MDTTVKVKQIVAAVLGLLQAISLVWAGAGAYAAKITEHEAIILLVGSTLIGIVQAFLPRAQKLLTPPAPPPTVAPPK
jgi:hypothetical protein